MTARPLEQAQLLWDHAVGLVNPITRHDRFGAVLDVLRAADHDPTTIAHALALGRTQLAVDVNNVAIQRGVDTLVRAIAFLGPKPNHGDAIVWRVS